MEEKLIAQLQTIKYSTQTKHPSNFSITKVNNCHSQENSYKCYHCISQVLGESLPIQPALYRSNA